MISRHLLWKCALVLLLLAPLILVVGWHNVSPTWLRHDLDGVPMTAVASVALFLVLAILTAMFSVPPASPDE